MGYFVIPPERQVLTVWDNPEPGVHEAFTTRTTEVALEVFEPQVDDDDDSVCWWAVAEGRVIAVGTAQSVEDAKRQVEAAAKL